MGIGAISFSEFSRQLRTSYPGATGTALEESHERLLCDENQQAVERSRLDFDALTAWGAEATGGEVCGDWLDQALSFYWEVPVEWVAEGRMFAHRCAAMAMSRLLAGSTLSSPDNPRAGFDTPQRLSIQLFEDAPCAPPPALSLAFLGYLYRETLYSMLTAYEDVEDEEFSVPVAFGLAELKEAKAV